MGSALGPLIFGKILHFFQNFPMLATPARYHSGSLVLQTRLSWNLLPCDVGLPGILALARPTPSYGRTRTASSQGLKPNPQPKAQRARRNCLGLDQHACWRGLPAVHLGVPQGPSLLAPGQAAGRLLTVATGLNMLV